VILEVESDGYQKSPASDEDDVEQPVTCLRVFEVVEQSMPPSCELRHFYPFSALASEPEEDKRKEHGGYRVDYNYGDSLEYGYFVVWSASAPQAQHDHELEVAFNENHYQFLEEQAVVKIFVGLTSCHRPQGQRLQGHEQEDNFSKVESREEPKGAKV